VGPRNRGVSTRGAALSVVRGGRFLAALTALALSGCVAQAVLENDVRSAQWKARTLSTAADPSLAHAALSAQLVELEALYQRDSSDTRVLGLLDRGYRLMAHGFVELRYLEALGAGDLGRAEQEAMLRADAEARARYYRERLATGGASSAPLRFESDFAEPDAACARHDRAAYEQQLNALLAASEKAPEERLERALSRRLASARLLSNVAERCKF
jgi:hypothetical protein